MRKKRFDRLVASLKEVGAHVTTGFFFGPADENYFGREAGKTPNASPAARRKVSNIKR